MINPNQASTDPKPAYNKNKTLQIQNLIRSDQNPLPVRSKDHKTPSPNSSVHSPVFLLVERQRLTNVFRVGLEYWALRHGLPTHMNPTFALSPVAINKPRTMKVHPTPKKRNMTTTQYDAASPTYIPKAKKLKRLPHVFARVLELPFHSNTDVLVQETPDRFRIVANSESITVRDDYQAHVVEIFPGVTKIVVIRETDSDDHDLSVDVLDNQTWRFRLPATVRLDMASTRCIRGQLIVTIPKALNFEDFAGRQEVEDNAFDEHDTSPTLSDPQALGAGWSEEGFNKSPKLPIVPEDAAVMQVAENQVLGETPRGGHASVMQSAARLNVRAGLLDRDEGSDVVGDQGMVVPEKNVVGDRVITESIGGQAVATYIEPRVPMTPLGLAPDQDAITIGEALEATALSAAGNKPVDHSDAAAIQAAEVRATGLYEVLSGGIGTLAQSAGESNPRARRNEDKTTLSDVLTDASMKLASDRIASREDAEGMIEAEVRNKPNKRTTPGGVATSVAAAARLDQNTRI
ncbi:unnamed protein product [Dovyalis caffra]|uniref:SMP domain-containing protein n=1 Tax=Dovyalis caffra TaxID=77055 RepID=A0AAV1S9I3_9ROSI|nr:unnamed protein product [Dovyalis caffra]